MLWIDWKLTYDTMTCPGCGFEFDGEAAISIVTSHEPSKNSGDFGQVRQLIKKKKELVSLGQQMAAMTGQPKEPRLPSPPAQPSAQPTTPFMADVVYHALLQQAQAAQQVPKSQPPAPRRVVRVPAQPTLADLAMLLDDIALAETDQLMSMMRLQEKMG